jgi:hypothetical protein
MFEGLGCISEQAFEERPCFADWLHLMTDVLARHIVLDSEYLVEAIEAYDVVLSWSCNLTVEPLY